MAIRGRLKLDWARVAVGLGVLTVGLGPIGVLMSKGPLVASLANEHPYAVTVTKPQGENHPSMRTAMAPLGLGTNVFLTYAVNMAPGSSVCLFAAWVYDGEVQTNERHFVECVAVDPAGRASFGKPLPVVAYGRQPGLIAALTLPNGTSQVDYLTLSRK